MSCINPLTIRVNKQNIKVPCNHCLNCLIKKQSQLEFLAKRELIDNYQKGLGASFVTFTYNDDNIPKNHLGFNTLVKKDLQDLMKRIRRNMEYSGLNIKYKYIACGELGDKFSRPHYHIIFIGLSDVLVEKFSKKCWKKGIIDVGPLAQGGLQYVINYMSKSSHDKEVCKIYRSAEIEKPFLIHSIGLGKDWIKRNMNKIYENKFTFNNNGKISLYPKYVVDYVSNCLAISKAEKKHILNNFYKNNQDYIKSGKDYQTFLEDDSYLKYIHKCAALRSKQVPINDITLNKAYVKPKSRRIYPDLSYLVDKALCYNA